MGLDAVELILAVEEEFGIEISDADAVEMTAVGDLVDLVYRLMQGRDVERLERQLDADWERVMGLKISSLPPETKVANLPLQQDRLLNWRDLEWKPPLHRTRVCKCAIGLLVLGAMVGGHYSGFSFWGVGLSAFIVWLTAMLLTMNFVYPRCDLEIQDLMWWRHLETEKYPDRKAVFDQVSKIIVEQLGVEPNLVTDEAEFCADLGVG